MISIKRFFLLALTALACTAAQAQSTPAPSKAPLPTWVETHIKGYEADPEHAEAIEIWKMTFKGKDAYLFISNCCDQYNPLYDESGKVLCFPSGGIVGQGDGRCPRALHESPERVRIWSLAPPAKKSK